MNSQGVLPLSVLSLRGQGVGEQERVLVLPQRVSRSAMGGPQRCVLDGAVHPLDQGRLCRVSRVPNAVGHADAVEAVPCPGSGTS